ncbi:uncharacterized protein [Ptychodera flava]|uniref:uncharacterized protein n=1 Tax=Ptychodera flava TaxID=63121 RepID=UPI00396A44DD
MFSKLFCLFLASSILLIKEAQSFLEGDFYEVPVWTWIGGAKTRNETSVFNGDETLPQNEEYPGARAGSAIWSDGKGDVWMFGGEGFDVTEAKNQADPSLPFFPANGDATYLLNSLWKFDALKRTWRAIHKSGNYSDIPTARHHATACGIRNKFLLIYGGLGYNFQAYSDLWMFDFQDSLWKRIDFAQRNSSFPEARGDPSSWCTGEELWIFGGLRGNSEVLSDFWVLSLTSLTWSQLNVTVDMVERDQTVSISHKSGAATWTVDGKYLYMFGGNVMQNYQHYRHLAKGLTSDLWQYSTESGLWSFVTGFTETRHPGEYGILGQMSSLNNPGCREHGASWVDNDGNLWLFGGEGTATKTIGFYTLTHLLADLWMFDVSAGMWTWMGGFNTEDPDVFYGIKGKQDVSISPGPRCESVVWYFNYTAYLFGGLGHDHNDNDGWLNDLWIMNMMNSSSDSLLFLGTEEMPLSPVKAFLMTLGIIVGVSILFVFATWGKKCCNLPRHKPSAKSPAGFDVKYSPLSDDTEFTIMSTPMKDIPSF